MIFSDSFTTLQDKTNKDYDKFNPEKCHDNQNYLQFYVKRAASNILKQFLFVFSVIAGPHTQQE